MSENRESELTKDQEKGSYDKDTEYYAQSLAAWFNTALEHDKSLLTLSVAGIGVLVSMMQTAIDSVSALLLYACAILAFMICLVSVLLIFKGNKKHILDVLNKSVENDPRLGILDNVAGFSFFIAILLSAMLGISSATTTYIDKANKMANEKKVTGVTTADSVNGFAGLNPANESFDQMAKLKVKSQSSSQTQNQSLAQPQQSAASQAQSTTPTASSNNETSK